MGKVTHGQARRHGGRTAEHRIWGMMLQRCTNPKNEAYKDYGDRGISVCDRWRQFENFFADMGPRPSPRHTIERANNNLGYSPLNCNWQTRKVQNRNYSRNRLITFDGLTMCVTDWAEHIGIPAPLLLARIGRGVSVPLAFSAEMLRDGSRRVR